MKDKICRICGKTYTPLRSLQSVCSPRCSFVLIKNKRKEKYIKLKEVAYGRQTLIEKLDRITSKITILRYKGKCVICGSTETGEYNRPNNGHLITRKIYKLRWDIRKDGNCHNQCMQCNKLHIVEPHHYISWYIDTFGVNKYNQLVKESKQETHYKDWQLKEMLDQREKIYQTMLEKAKDEI